MSKHTPGPWHLRHDGNHDGDRSVESATRDICKMDGGQNDDSEILANARLIAAAPELLVALRDMLRKFRSDVLPGESGWDAVTQAEAAIAKAEGQFADA